MIIGIDASRANRDHKSGTEWYSYYLIKWLAKLDPKNQYILYADKPLKGGLIDLTERNLCDFDIKNEKIEYDKNGFQILKSPYNNFKAKILNWPFRFFWTQCRMSIEMIFNKVDVLFIPAHALPIIHPSRSIVTIHDIGFKREKSLYDQERMGPDNKDGKKILNFLVRLLTMGAYGANLVDYHCWSTKYALKKAKKIITVSNFSKHELLEVYGKRNKEAMSQKIKVIYNGYNDFLYKKEEDKTRVSDVLDKYGISAPYILYVGRLEKKKNIFALIEAFAIMRENDKNIKHKLVLVGNVSFGYDEVNYMIEEFSLDREVIMPGWIAEMDMSVVYAGASAFVFPSLYEGFGIPLLQAMACEVPIAASAVASIPEVVGGAALLFNPRDVKDMAGVLKKVLTDEKLRAELVLRGRERVANFSWEKCARETLAELTDNTIIFDKKT